MAIFKSTAFSRLRNSLGNLTTYILKGQNIVREKVTDVSNPRTLKQQQQRACFATLVEASNLFSQAIALGLVSKETKQTTENYFVHLNKDAVTVNAALEVEINYPSICIAKGNRAMPEEITVRYDSNAEDFIVNVEEEEFVKHAAPDDEFFCCVVEKTKQRSRLILLGERSKLEPVVLNLPTTWDRSPNNLAFYVFCVTKDRTRAGNSVYVAVG